MIKNTLLVTLLSLSLASCKHGFYEPYTLDMEVPDGPPEYRAGYRSGCRSGLGVRVFTNSFVYKPDYGNGIYQHDPKFQAGWQHGWFACVIHTGVFVSWPATRHGPLQ